MIRLLLLVAAGLVACGSAERQAPEPGAADQAHASGRWMTEAIASGRTVPACGGDGASASLAMLVLLNARQALSCRDAGFLLRRLQSRGRDRGERISLVVPAADTAAVCRFLSDERVRLPVLAVSASEEHPVTTPILTLVQFRPDGAGYALHHGLRGADILASLGRSPPPATAEPSSTLQGASR